MSRETSGKVRVPDPKFPGDASKVLSVEAVYSLGGMNFFSYKRDPRGYSIHVVVMTVESRDGFTSEIMTPFGPTQESGLRFFVEPAARLNRKRLAVLGDFARANATEIVAKFRALDYEGVRAMVNGVAAVRAA